METRRQQQSAKAAQEFEERFKHQVLALALALRTTSLHSRATPNDCTPASAYSYIRKFIIHMPCHSCSFSTVLYEYCTILYSAVLVEQLYSTVRLFAGSSQMLYLYSIEQY